MRDSGVILICRSINTKKFRLKHVTRMSGSTGYNSREGSCIMQLDDETFQKSNVNVTTNEVPFCGEMYRSRMNVELNFKFKT